MRDCTGIIAEAALTDAIASDALHRVHARARALRTRLERLACGSRVVVRTLARRTGLSFHAGASVVTDDSARAVLQGAVADAVSVGVEVVVVSVAIHVADAERRSVVQHLTATVTVAVDAHARVLCVIE